jgi:TonB family protein
MSCKPRKTTATLPLLLVLLLAPLAVRAQESPAPAAVTPYRFFGGVEPLMSEQTRVVDLLLAGKWREAQPLARRQFLVLAGFVEKYPGLAATSLALEALADAGLGDKGPAACRWQAAQNVDPKLANADLSSFGDAGALLKSRSAQTPAGAEPLKISAQADQDKKAQAGEVQKPEILTQIPPQYPEAARRARVEGKVILESIIDKEGNIINLRVLQGQPMGLDLAATEAVCGWRFKPATLEGEPVKVYYVLTVNFKVEKSPPPPISNP